MVAMKRMKAVDGTILTRTTGIARLLMNFISLFELL